MRRPPLASYVIALYTVACVVYGLHALDTNPQYDNQVIRYAQEEMVALRNGELGSYLLEARKYPMAYVMPFFVAYEIVYRTTGDLNQQTVFVISRFLTMLFGVGTFIILYRLGRRIGNGTDAVLLLITSILFLLFTSAIRPHMLVAFWTLVTLLLSVRLREAPSVKRATFAFASAAITFATLQNGIFAFTFPIWALLEHPRTPRTFLRTATWTVLWGVAAILGGYPFVLRPLFGLDTEAGADLGHDVGLRFDPLMPLHWIPQLGGELILGGFAAAMLWLSIRSKRLPAPWFVPIFVVIALYLAAFGFHVSAAGRFFLPLLPLLALMGAPVFAELPARAKQVVCVLTILACAKLIWLSVVPNTYQLINAFAVDRPGTLRTLYQPIYFFVIDPRTVAANSTPLADVDTIVLPDYGVKPPELEGRADCFHAASSRTTDEIVLLWNDTPWALWTLFEASRLGPNMTVYCTKDSINQG